MALLAILGALLELVALLPYVRDVLRGTTRPHRGTFLIWGTLAVVAFASQLADGAAWSLLLVAAQIVQVLVILALSRTRGVGGTSRLEIVLLLVAALGLVGWFAADNPTVATLSVIAADAIGFALMLPKTWRDPWSETFSSYAMTTAGALLTAAAIDDPSFSLLVYPLYIAVACGTVCTVIAVQRARLRTA